MRSRSEAASLVAWGALMLGAVSGCLAIRDFAAHRAEREFMCPAERIATLDRPDITHGLVDVDACGQRARYMCVGFHQCVREPDPPKWDPDPALCFSNDPKVRPTGCDPFTAPSQGGQHWSPSSNPL